MKHFCNSHSWSMWWIGKPWFQHDESISFWKWSLSFFAGGLGGRSAVATSSSCWGWWFFWCLSGCPRCSLFSLFGSLASRGLFAQNYPYCVLLVSELSRYVEEVGYYSLSPSPKFMDDCLIGCVVGEDTYHVSVGGIVELIPFLGKPLDVIS